MSNEERIKQLEDRLAKLEKKTTYPIEIQFQKAIEQVKFDSLNAREYKSGTSNPIADGSHAVTITGDGGTVTITTKGGIVTAIS